MRYILALLVVIFGSIEGSAQTEGALSDEEAETFLEGVNFNGLGRVYLQQSGIGGDILNDVMVNDSTSVPDTLTPRNTTDGEFLLDLKVNATPNRKTEVQAILRLRNEFGGFFGAGQSIQVRELWARGIIGDRLEYRVGDMDIEMSPYTFYVPEEEGVINQPSAFDMQREVIYYEQFYTHQNSRRMQGASLNFGLKFTQVLKEADFSGFIARVRGTDFLTIPTRWVAGGDAKFKTRRLIDQTKTSAEVGFNLVHTFDDLQSGDANTGIRNTVFTVDYDLKAYETEKMIYSLFGESGQSTLTSLDDVETFFEQDDFFVTVSGGAEFKEDNLIVHAGYADIGPQFFSMGAQSKRVDFDAARTYYNRAGVEQNERNTTLFDLSRDIAVYTFQLSDKLMTYDPRFSNTFPYGDATPNRRGLRYGADYDQEKIQASLDGALMSEIQGQGTEELKDFFIIQAAVDVNVNKFLEWKNKINFTLGYQFENTNRGGIEVDQVDLTSNLIEGGLELELFDDFELLFGAKTLISKGNDYLPRIDQFDQVVDFPERFEVDDTELLLAGGIKYTFKEGIYLTLQYQSFDATGRSDVFRDYTLDQIFVLYTMNF
ncbi:MAG: hypothetical protein MK086_03950 [Flavobacteriales bacterium]|nr:hypothetical protein [Flavobacteriales bacterium]